MIIGRNNGNCKYKTLNDDFFKCVDSEAKAYLLGWIASDGCIQKNNIAISIHKKDICVLEQLKNIICAEIPIKNVKNNNVTITINSCTIANDVCKLLKINPGKKSSVVQMPELSEENTLHFIRGYFDGDGHIIMPGGIKKYPVCGITSNSVGILRSIYNYINIPGSRYDNRIEWCHNNALDVLGKLYDKAKYRLPRKYDIYIDWCCWVPSLVGKNTYGKCNGFKYNKIRKDAVAPFKNKPSDSGYDLTILERKKNIGEVELYSTGIKIQPDFGLYFDLVPRSSIIKTGYVLANSIGIIDRTYTGEIMVPLIRIDNNAPDLPLPCRVVQLIPRPIIHMQMEEVDSFDETSRGENGYGSSGR